MQTENQAHVLWLPHWPSCRVMISQGILSSTPFLAFQLLSPYSQALQGSSRVLWGDSVQLLLVLRRVYPPVLS